MITNTNRSILMWCFRCSSCCSFLNSYWRWRRYSPMTIMIRKESHSMIGDRTWCPFDSLKLVYSFARVICHKLSTNPISQTQTTPRDSRAGLGPPSQWLLHRWYTSSWMLRQWDPISKQKKKVFRVYVIPYASSFLYDATKLNKSTHTLHKRKV